MAVVPSTALAATNCSTLNPACSANSSWVRWADSRKRRNSAAKLSTRERLTPADMCIHATTLGNAWVLRGYCVWDRPAQRVTLHLVSSIKGDQRLSIQHESAGTLWEHRPDTIRGKNAKRLFERTREPWDAETHGVNAGHLSRAEQLVSPTHGASSWGKVSRSTRYTGRWGNDTKRMDVSSGDRRVAVLA